MRIAVPVEEPSQSSPVASVFGRTSHFLIYDQAQKSYEFFENAARQRPGGAGVQAAQLLVDKGVQVVIAPQLGANALQILKSAQIKFYRSRPGSAQQNLESYANSELEILEGTE